MAQQTIREALHVQLPHVALPAGSFRLLLADPCATDLLRLCAA
jgi:hypothetical protein